MTTTVEPTSRRASAAAPVGESASQGPARTELPVVRIDSTAQWSRWLADVRQYRGALYSLAWRNIRSRYKQAVLGVAWALIQPAVQVGVFTVLFGIIARVPSGDVPYPVFALTGLLVWNLFARIVSEGSQSLVANQHMITKIFFPRVFLVLAAGASALIDALATVLMLTVFMIAYDVALASNVWLVVPALLGLLLFSYGFAALLAALNARWRDVQHIVPFALQVGLFLTPVLYSTIVVPERFQWLAAWNPLTGWIAMVRSGIVDAPLPASGALLQSLGMSVAITFLGLWYFARAERTVVDVV